MREQDKRAKKDVSLTRVRDVKLHVGQLLTAVDQNPSCRDPNVAGACVKLRRFLEMVPDEPLSNDVQKVSFSELCNAAVKLVNELQSRQCFPPGHIDEWLKAFLGRH